MLIECQLLGKNQKTFCNDIITLIQEMFLIPYIVHVSVKNKSMLITKQLSQQKLFILKKKKSKINKDFIFVKYI